MILCIPMAGTSKRFKDAGLLTPKPFLEIAGNPLLQYALGSLSKLEGRYEYLMNQEVASHPMATTLRPMGHSHILQTQTPGPLQTLLTIRDCLTTEEELLIMDCDSCLDKKELKDAVEVFRKSGANGGVTVRMTIDPLCSYAEVDSNYWVTETREKEVFSRWSTTGPYWFRSAAGFLIAAQKAANAHHVSISPVYNYLTKVKAVPVGSFKHLGTPEAYLAFKQSVESLIN